MQIKHKKLHGIWSSSGILQLTSVCVRMCVFMCTNDDTKGKLCAHDWVTYGPRIKSLQPVTQTLAPYCPATAHKTQMHCMRTHKPLLVTATHLRLPSSEE